ncbi:uncharacterized protein LOC144467978 [Augochlora pura]
MRSRVNLVAVLLTLSCVVRLLETSKSAVRYHEQNLEKIIRKDHGTAGKKVLIKGIQNKVTPNTAVLLLVDDKTKTAKEQTKNNDNLPASKDYLTGGRPRRKMHKMDRTMMALLIAYKMKFVALIPTMVGGLILLKATALLAGFFFALFAAVLGLKVR